MDTCFTYDGSQPVPKNVVRVIVAANVTTILQHAFFKCRALEYIELPDSLTTIEEGAFAGCESLTSIKLPSSLTTLEEAAFYGCESLTSIDLPSSLTILGDWAFASCTSLASIDLPSSLTTLGDQAFASCTSLTSIKLPSSLTTLGYRAFDGCTSLTSIELPSSLTTLGAWALRDCTSLTSIDLPSSLTTLGIEAFSGCTSLTSIDLPSSLTTLGDWAFRNCISLTSIGDLSSTSLTTLGKGAFKGCTSLASIDLPSSLTTLGNYAFNGCTSLTSTDLPSSLTTLGDFAFLNCTNLLPVQIPPNATIGYEAFKGCTKIQKARLEGSFNASAGGVHDSPATDPDRLGYTVYAKSLVEVTQEIESPDTSLCAALYGPWGSGKTFLKRMISEVQDERKAKKYNKDSIQTKEKRCLDSVCQPAVFICKCLTCNFSKSPHIESVATVLATLPILWPIWLPICICVLPFKYCIARRHDDHEYIQISQMEEGEQPPAEITFSQVWNILDGTTSLHSSTLSFRNRNCMEMMRYYLLSFLIKPVIHMFALPAKLMKWLRSVLCKKKYKTTEDKALTKYVEVNFNAWVYNGSDHLWASLLEEMWSSIEKEFGAYRVRLHRASISISGELDSDDVRMKRNKRDAAIVGLKMKAVLYLILFLVGNGFAFVYRDSIMLFLDGALPYVVPVLSSSPLLGWFVSFVRKVLPELLKSQGAKIVKEVKGFEKHQRANFKEETGFMGKVKKEVEYLFDFLRTELVDDQDLQLQIPVRLSVFVDDLDRCQPKAIMSVLEAVILLLADAPITCWLAIDSRVIVSSIEAYYGEHFMKEGLDGYKFLDKIVQLPFCIPELTHDSKSAFIRKIALKNELDPVRIYQRVKHLHSSGALGRIVTSKQESFIEFLTAAEKRDNRSTTIPPQIISIYKDVLLPLFEYLMNATHKDSIFDEIRKGPIVGLGMNKPDELLAAVDKRRLLDSSWNDQDHFLGKQREEEFLHFLFFAIEKIRQNELAGSWNQQVQGSQIPGSDSNKVESSDIKEGFKSTSTSIKPTPAEIPNEEITTLQVEKGSLNAASSSGSKELVEIGDIEEGLNSSSTKQDPNEDKINDPNGIYKGIKGFGYLELNPMLDMFESECFHRYSKYCNGEPRKIKRIINSYMVSRSVAKQAVFRAAGTGSDALGNILREKLLKLIILCEQWPYRMSWLFVLIENLQQEKIITRTVNHNDKSHVPVGRFLTSILDHECDKKSKENNGTGVENSYEKLPLLELYHLVVEGLIHSPDDARLQLQRDADPQVFEMLLSDSGGGDVNNDDAARILRAKDVASCCSGKEISSDDGSLRPFIFNLQRHMIEKVQLYVDECVVHPPASQPRLQCNHSAFFEKKSAFFRRSKDRINNEADSH